MTKLEIFLIILAITVLGMILRAIAFRRADSYAVEISKASVITYGFLGLMQSTSLAVFIDDYLKRFIVLLVLALAICLIHRLFSSLCFEGIVNKLNTAKDDIRYKVDTENTEMEMKLLDSVGNISKRSLYISYSRFIDKFLRDFPLTRIFFKNQAADDGCKPGKTELRKSLAEVSNYIVESSLGERLDRNNIFKEADFNIPESAQMIGLFCFQILPILSVVIAVGVI